MARIFHLRTFRTRLALCAAVACGVIGGTHTAQAQAADADPHSAALNLGLATKLCLTNYRTPDAFQDAYTGAGFTLLPGIDEGTFEVNGYGVWGLFDETSGYCTFQSQAVPLETTQPLIRDLANQLFPDMVQPGAPEGGDGPCDGISIFAPQKLIWVHYAAAGNSGECLFDGTSAIIVQ